MVIVLNTHEGEYSAIPTEILTYNAQKALMPNIKRTQVAFVTVKDMFAGSMTDVCWSSDGLRLAMSSQDGSVAIIEFNEAEIGRPIPDASFSSIIERAYGAEAAQKFAANRARSRALSRQNVESKTLSFTSGTEAQKETVDAKGRRRITPVSLTGAGFGQGAAVQGQAQAAPPPPQVQPPPPLPRTSHQDSSQSGPVAPAAPVSLQIKRKSDAAEGGGKRSSAPHQHQHHQHQSSNAATPHATSHSSPIVEAPFNSAAAATSLQSRLGGSVGFSPVAEASSAIQVKSTSARLLAAAAGGQHALDAAEYTATTRLQGCGATPTVISFIKATASSTAAAHLSRGSNVLWRQPLPSNPSCCSGVDSSFSVVVCCDASMHAFAPDGERIALPLRIESPVSRVMTRVYLGVFYVMVLSCSGRFKVWDLKQQRCVCSGDIEAFLSSHSLIQNIDVQLLPTGVPLVAIGSSAWAYHAPMQSWMCVCDASTSAMQLHPAPPIHSPSILESIELSCGCPLPAPPPPSSLTAVVDYMQLMLQRLQVHHCRPLQSLPRALLILHRLPHAFSIHTAPRFFLPHTARSSCSNVTPRAQSCFASICNAASVSGSRTSLSVLHNAGSLPTAIKRCIPL